MFGWGRDRGRDAERPWARYEDPGETGARLIFLAGLLAAASFVLIGALSFRQVAEPATAARLLAAGIAATVDIDAYLEQETPDLEVYLARTGAASTRLPGYPIDVFVSRTEIEGDRAALRTAVLERSAASVYTDGIGAFDLTGEQSIDMFSWESIVRFVVDRVSESTHSRAGWIAFIAAFVLAGCAAGLAILPSVRRPYRAIAAAVLVGAIPGVALSGLGYVIAGQFGSDTDPYASEIREVLRAGFEVPLRNYLVLAGAGGAIAAIGGGLALLGRVLPETIGFARDRREVSPGSQEDRG